MRVARDGEPAVLVTGAASGIGRAVAVRCLSEGRAVVALDLDDGGLTRLVEEAESGSVVPLVADVSDHAAVEEAVAGLARQVQRLEGVVNAAGIGGYSGDVAATTPEVWSRTLAVNLSGTFYVSRAALFLLRANGGGSVVHVSSQYALVGCAGSPAYLAAKSGLLGLTRAMAVDHAPESIRVNCVCPGPTDTPMLRSSAAESSSERARVAERERERTALRPLLPAPARPDDIASVVSFLLGPGSANLTGAVIAADGGWTAS